MSVAEADSFKPYPSSQQTAAALVGVERQVVFFVASYAFDYVDAKAASLRSSCINRASGPSVTGRCSAAVTVCDLVEWRCF